MGPPSRFIPWHAKQVPCPWKIRRPALTISGGMALVSGKAGTCTAGAWSAAENAAAPSAKASAPAAHAMFETGIVTTPAIGARPANESYLLNEPSDAQGCCHANILSADPAPPSRT